MARRDGREDMKKLTKSDERTMWLKEARQFMVALHNLFEEHGFFIDCIGATTLLVDTKTDLIAALTGECELDEDSVE